MSEVIDQFLKINLQLHLTTKYNVTAPFLVLFTEEVGVAEMTSNRFWKFHFQRFPID